MTTTSESETTHPPFIPATEAELQAFLGARLESLRATPANLRHVSLRQQGE